MTGAVPHCEPDHCITCSDEGLPMRALEPGVDGLVPCEDAGGAQHRVMTDLVGRVAEGDMLLVHAGVALLRLSGEPAG